MNLAEIRKKAQQSRQGATEQPLRVEQSPQEKELSPDFHPPLDVPRGEDSKPDFPIEDELMAEIEMDLLSRGSDSVKEDSHAPAEIVPEPVPELSAPVVPVQIAVPEPPAVSQQIREIIPEPLITAVEQPATTLPPVSAVVSQIVSQPLTVTPVSAEEQNKPDPKLEDIDPIADAKPHRAPKLKQFDPLSILMEGRENSGINDFEDFVSGNETSEILDQDIEEYLCIRVANEKYAINIMAIKEIIKPREATEVPRMPQFISGIISLRGVIIPIIDMRRRLGLAVGKETEKQRVVVLKNDDGFFGVLVDEVIQVVRLHVSSIEQPPAVLEGIDRDFVQGIGRFDDRMLILLNLGSILDLDLR